MISTLRNKKKLITFSLWFIIAAFIGTIFFVWGVGDKAAQQLYAAKVDETVITDQDFRQKVEDTRNQFRQLFGNNVDDLLKDTTVEKTVMETLIDEALLRNEAANLNIPVSDSEVSSTIQSMQVFQTDGQFDQERYVQLLARNRLIPQIFEEGVRRDILLSKMKDLINKSVAVSDQEINKEYVYSNTQASIRFLELNADDFVTQVKITDEALAAFYDENKETYRVPEKADFKYVVFDPETYEGNYEATDAEIENYFIRNKASFTVPEQVEASHILLKVDNWDDEMDANEVYKKAKDIKAQIDKGADFAAMAKKYSQDATAQTGGELGYFTKGQMVPEFETAAFETEVGKVSDVVKTQFGFHIIKVQDHKPEQDPTLDEVKEAIASTIMEAKKKSAFRTYVYDTYREILNMSNITAYNEKAEDKLDTSEIKGLTAAGNVEPMLGLGNIAAKLLTLGKSEISQVIEIDAKQMVFEMTEKYDSFIPELADIKERVTADFVKLKSLELAQAKAAEAAALATMDEAAEMLNQTYTTTPKFKRTDPIKGLGMNQDLMEVIFRSEPETFIKDSYTVGSKVFLVQVKDIVKPDVAAITDEEKEQIKSALFGVKSQAAMDAYVLNLKKKAKIEINNRYAEFYK